MPVCTVYSSVQSAFSKKKIEQAVLSVFGQLKKNGNISIHIVGERKIRTLNKNYRGKDKVTDVLSFGVDDDAPGEMHDWGDIFLCQQRVKRQSKEFSVTFEEEFFRMLTHGTLHLFGYDHEKKSDAEVMFPLQEKLLEMIKKDILKKRR